MVKNPRSVIVAFAMDYPGHGPAEMCTDFRQFDAARIHDS